MSITSSCQEGSPVPTTWHIGSHPAVMMMIHFWYILMWGHFDTFWYWITPSVMMMIPFFNFLILGHFDTFWYILIPFDIGSHLWWWWYIFVFGKFQNTISSSFYPSHEDQMAYLVHFRLLHSFIWTHLFLQVGQIGFAIWKIQFPLLSIPRLPM